MELDDIASCLDVTDEHIARALAAARSLNEPSPREKALRLLERMVAVAAPGMGAPRMLVLLAQMAKRDWLDGELIVRLIGDLELTVLELLIDDGVSRERMLGPLRIDVPLNEFATAIDLNGAMLLPLQTTEKTPRRLLLRGRREHKAMQRKASISAFAVDLVRGFAGAAPQSGASSAPASVDNSTKRIASYEKRPATLDMPDDLRADPPSPAPVDQQQAPMVRREAGAHFLPRPFPKKT